MQWWLLPDRELLDQCERDHYRASGPGGQHRNRTDSAVRLRHKPTGVTVTATERRSQHENLAKALTRLREAIALELRRPTADRADPPELAERINEGKLAVRVRDPAFLTVANWVLDLLVEREAQVSTVATDLGISTGSLIKFLGSHDGLWEAVQRLRRSAGLPNLK
jgi:hypothetical protein